jgi:hypothetical protein
MAEPQLLMKGVLHTFVPNGSFHVLGIISTLKSSIWWNLKFNFMMFCMQILRPELQVFGMEVESTGFFLVTWFQSHRLICVCCVLAMLH